MEAGKQSVKINNELVFRVKKHVIDSRQTIGGFIELAVEKQLARIEKNKERFLRNKLIK